MSETSGERAVSRTENSPERAAPAADLGRAAVRDQVDLDLDSVPDLPDDPDRVDPELDLDSLPDPAAARAQVEAAYRMGDLRAEINDIYASGEGPTPSTPEEYAQQAREWAQTVDQPADGRQLVDAPEPEEQQVIDAAKADLRDRQDAGEILGGDPVGRADLWHQQGRNEPGYQQDCALASTAEVLQDCGVPAREDDVVKQAAAEGRCETRNSRPADNGGVRSMEDVASLLEENGVAAEVERPADEQSLAARVEDGHGVITAVNAGELWDGRYDVGAEAYGYDQDGRPAGNHAVVVTGTTRDAEGNLTGFVINDPGVPDGAGIDVPLDRWDRCWTQTDREHETVVTERPTSTERRDR